MNRRILVTGGAGFIGFHLCKRLIKEGIKVYTIDNLNNYYDVALKVNRIKKLKSLCKNDLLNFKFSQSDITDRESLKQIFKKFKPNEVVNLAAQAGVRYSIENPYEYIQSNLVGFGNVLEECRKNNVRHLVYASSSSVYGGNRELPFKENSGVDHPVSIYAATKRSNELMAHTYSHLYCLPSTGLRFFTVYGPWGRPDMALYKFTKCIDHGLPIDIYNNGNMKRAFTYIDDVIEALYRVLNKPPKENKKFFQGIKTPSSSWSPHKIFNIGSSTSTNLMTYIEEIENAMKKKAIKNFLPIQPGDIAETSAYTDLLEEYIHFRPKTSIKRGISQFVKWYIDYKHRFNDS